MQMNYGKILIAILIGAFLLNGCSFFTGKKTEVSFREGQNEGSLEEKKESGESREVEPEKTEEPSSSAEQANESEIVSASKPEPDKNQAEKQIETEREIKKEPEEDVSKVPKFKIIDRLSDWGFSKSSGRKIDTVIVHSSYNALDEDIYDLDKIIGIYESYGVAPHYIISREGKIYRMVEEKNIAYHAGESKMPDGRKNVNNFSIGIEMVNSKTEGPTKAQYGSLGNLLGYLKDKYDIKYTLGHSDIAPGRKDDPWKFDWDKIK